MKLQYRIILSVVLGLSAVMLIFTYLAVWTLGKSTDADDRARLIIAEAIASHLDALIEHSMDVLQKTATFPGLTLEDVDITLKREILRDTNVRLAGFANVALTDSSGQVLASEPDQLGLTGNMYVAQPVVAAAFKTGEPQRGEWHTELDDDHPMACLAVPVRNQSGTIIGILMAKLDPAALGFQVTQAASGEGAVLVELVNESRVLASPSQTNGRSRLNAHAAIIAPFVIEHRAGIAVHELPGVPRHTVAYAPLDILSGWGVLMEQPQYTFLNLPQDLQKQLFFFGAITLLLAVAFAWLDIRRVVKPLNDLSIAAARIGTGDLASPISNLHRKDEIGTLTRSVETMRQRLRDLIDKREQYEAELEKRAEQRAGEVTALLAASQAFTSTLDVSSLLQIILVEAQRICPYADAGVVMLSEPRLGSLVPMASFGCDLEAIREVRLKPGEGIPGKVFASGEPMLLVDNALADYDRDLSADNGELFKSAGLMDGRVRGAMCVPLAAKRSLLGVLAVYDFKDASACSEAGLKALQAIAYQAAIALENAGLYLELQQKEELRGKLLVKVITAQEEERRRIARELHDEFAQALAAIRMSLEAVEAGTPSIPEVQRQRLGQAKSLSEEALTDVRRMILDLRPTILDDLGLGSAVRAYAQQRLEMRDIHVFVSVIGLRERLSSQVETEMYRVMQEGINNVAKHANATQTWIRLHYSDGCLEASIKDNGCGFELEKVGPDADGSHLGLLGMRERVELLGGSLSIHSLPEKGTCLTIKVPIEVGG